MRSVEKSRKIAQQGDAADGAPANIFNQTVECVGVRRNEHIAARVFCVAEGEEKARARVKFRLLINAHRKRAPAQTSETREHAERVAKIAEGFEVAIGDFCGVGSERSEERL